MWRRLTSPFREFGIVAGTLYLLNRLLQTLSPVCGVFVYDLMAQPITGRPMLPANLAKNLRFAEIERGDPQLELMPAREDIKAARFEQGATCLGAYRKDELLGYIWFCTRRYEEDEVRCTYELADVDRSVFDFDLVVLPKHRMGIGFTAIWHGANAYLRERGIQYTFSRLTRFNVVSRRAHDHLQWRRVGQALFLKLWTLEMMLSTLRPYSAMTWRRGQRIALQLSPDAFKSSVAASVDDEPHAVSGKESSP